MEPLIEKQTGKKNRILRNRCVTKQQIQKSVIMLMGLLEFLALEVIIFAHIDVYSSGASSVFILHETLIYIVCTEKHSDDPQPPTLEGNEETATQYQETRTAKRGEQGTGKATQHSRAAPKSPSTNTLGGSEDTSPNGSPSCGSDKTQSRSSTSLD